MERLSFTRTYLETLLPEELSELADEYGIEIPPGLHRRFIIRELLETILEESEKDTDEDFFDMEEVSPQSDLSESYNETVISAVLRNPRWLYVYWDFNLDQLQALKGVELEVSYFFQENARYGEEHYFVEVPTEEREFNCLLQGDFNFVRVTLFEKGNRSLALAFSNTVRIPKGNSAICKWNSPDEIPEILRLSGMTETWKQQFF